MAEKEYSDEIQCLLKEVVDYFTNEDRAVRERQIRQWRRLKLFWDGFQKLFYSEVAHDWRVWSPDAENEDDTNQAYYDKPVNVFKAYLESIIAALSVTVPPVKCYPDDADNTLDLETAKAGDKIAQLIYRHNDVPLLWLNALFIFCTEGMVACYNYTKEDESYGTREVNEYEEVEENHLIATCPMCGYQMDDRVMKDISNQQRDEFEPEDHDVIPHDIVINQGTDICPACMQLVDPDYKESPVLITRLVGTTHQPKGRQCLECYGGLYVKIPNWAKRQKDIPYLIWSYETHYANVIQQYPDLHDKLRAGSQGRGAVVSGIYDAYEQWGRLSTQYLGEYPRNTVTVRNAWLRPSAFNILDKEKADVLKKEFPDGCKVVFANDLYACAGNGSLDDCWTLSYNPLSDYLHHDPLGLLLTSIQEITNDLISLTLQTIEHGIPQTFADPTVLDFKAYKQMEAIPGGVYPATPKSGKGVGDSFYEVKTATLSAEIMPFGEKVQQLGQLVSGALPSLFGGQMSESKTASEYAMSRSQALQRLQNVWKMLTMWWKNIFGKVIAQQMKLIQEDEHDVEVNQFGEFQNVFIKYAELQGKIGRVELEANENLPMTWQQVKDVVMTLIQTGNPDILSILGAPENLPVIRQAIGLQDFFVPGEDDREKQYEEIHQLLNSTPIQVPVDPVMELQAATNGMPPPQPQEFPSVEVDPEIDNHKLEFEICRSWIVSLAGRTAKTDNPDGYKNVLLHAKMHLMFQQQMDMQQQMMAGAAPLAKPNELETKSAPIEGEGDVRTAQ